MATPRAPASRGPPGCTPTACARLGEDDWNPTADTLTRLERHLDGAGASVMASAAEIIAEAANGRMVVLVDDEDRENEGDLVIPAQMATPDVIAFMARHGRGLICLALTAERVAALELPPMARSNGTAMQTAFTVSIEAKHGVTTGISAADRARTVAVAIDHANGPDANRLARPRLSARRPARRRAGSSGPHGGGGGHRAPGRPEPVRCDPARSCGTMG